MLSTTRYIFPGLALGAALGQTGVVTNAMINRAAEVTLNNIRVECIQAISFRLLLS